MGDILGLSRLPVVKDLLAYLGVRETLTANRTYYVATTGSDANDGLSALTPFLTMQKAWDTIIKLDLKGFGATIQLADGTYTSPLLANTPPVGGTVTVQGNSVTPANVIISTTTHAFTVSNSGVKVTIRDLKIETSSGAGILTANDATVAFNNLDFGACATAHIYANSGSSVFNEGSYTITGAAPSHVLAQQSGRVTIAVGATVTITGALNFSGGFVSTTSGAIVTSAGVTWVGSVTGARYAASLNAIINTFGAGASYFPGDVAGTTTTGGQYS